MRRRELLMPLMLTLLGCQGAPAALDSQPQPLLSTSSDGTDTIGGYFRALGDLDGDGDLDVIGNGGDLWQNDGSGSFTAAGQCGGAAEDVAVGDLDGDGDLDFLLARNNGVVICSNLGAMAFSSATSITRGGSPILTNQLALADWDGDGDLDVALAEGNGQAASVWENDGNATFTEVWTGPAGVEAKGVAWGDVDGDGTPDAVFTAAGADVPRLYVNGGGSFGASQALSGFPQGQEFGLAFADLEVDGDLDLAHSVSNSIGPRVWQNSGGTLAYLSQHDTGSSSTGDDYDMPWGDVDLDGDPDLVVWNGNAPGSLRIREVTSDGASLTLAGSITYFGGSYRALADLDGDGAVDLVGNSGGDPDVVLNDAAPAFPGLLDQPVSGYAGHAWGDWDGDGDPDLAVARSDPQGPSGAGETQVYTNTGGTLSLAWTSPQKGSHLSVAWGDFDGDGDLDLGVGRVSTTLVYENINGSLVLTYTSPSVDGAAGVAWADWDGDGDLDLATAGVGVNRVYAAAAGTFSPVWTSSESEASVGLDWGDWDGDGDPDLAVASGAGAPTRVYDNSSGASLASVWTSSAGGDSQSVSWADADGDGDLDLLRAGTNDAIVFENLAGTSLVQAWSVSDPTGIGSAAWGDYDGDGDLDIATGTGSADPNRVYANGGALGFSLIGEVGTSCGASARTSWVDVDADGDLDLAWGDSTSEVLCVHENHRLTGPLFPNNPTTARITDVGGGLLGPAPHAGAGLALGPTVSFTVRVADAEGDAAPDLTFEYSPVGGGQWLPATVTGAGGPFAGSAAGTDYSFVWHRATDGADGDRLALRVTVPWQSPTRIAHPIQHGAIATASESFRAYECFPVDGDGDGADCAGDCDDADPANYPGNAELCDGQDNDCDTTIDEGFDTDNDGVTTCAGDCDDADPANYPGNSELCDGQDNDCDTNVDEGFDTDNDGVTTCAGDCDDADPAAFPGAPESCDTVDSDCDGDLVDQFVDTDGDDAPDCIDPDDDDDGFPDGVDCGPLDPLVYPNASEACDGLDSDCDGEIVDGFPDSDNDGVPDCVDLDLDGDGFDAVVDCDDTDTAIYPGATDLPDDGIDQDCNGADTVTCFEDLDGDTYGSVTSVLEADGDCTDDPGAADNDDDCDDSLASVFPGAPETVDDGVDQDCSGADSVTCFEDDDGDSFGGATTLVAADGDCVDLGESSASTDCDDADPSVFPGAVEICDGVDSDCDGDLVDQFADLDLDGSPDCADTDADGDGVDAGADCDDFDPTVFPGAVDIADDGIDQDCSGTDSVTCFEDLDGDGFGSANTLVSTDGSCLEAGESDVDTDCDDALASVFPGAVEVADDGIDQDCSGADSVTCFEDLDGDGFGSANTLVSSDGSCLEAGESDVDTDCDDQSATTYPGATEACDAVDSDCDGDLVDDFEDEDGDGSPDCIEDDSDGDGSVAGLDCDDEDPQTYPGAEELCDGLDNDCDGALPSAEQDADGDGVLGCDGDCDDEDASSWEGAPELCDGVDNDCDGEIDDDVTTVSWFRDADGDGWGDPDAPWSDNPDCAQPDGYVAADRAFDCDDDDSGVHPDAVEVCNGIDDDCDPSTEPPSGPDQDQDEDGWLACEEGGEAADCDDQNPTAQPDAFEVCDSGGDEDCDGFADGDDPDCAGAACTDCSSALGAPHPGGWIVLLTVVGLLHRRRSTARSGPARDR